MKLTKLFSQIVYRISIGCGFRARGIETRGNVRLRHGLRDLRPRRARGIEERKRSRVRRREPQQGACHRHAERRKYRHHEAASGGDYQKRIFNEAITRNAPSDSFRCKDDRWLLRVSGSNEEFILTPDGAAKPPDNNLIGKVVTVVGTMPQLTAGKGPTELHFQSVTEKK